MACVIFTSCKDVQCPAFGTEDKMNWLPQSVAEEIVFYREGTSIELVFLVKESYASAAYKHEVDSWPSPEHDCKVEGYIRAEANNDLLYHIRINSEYGGTEKMNQTLNYRLLDFNNNFSLFPLLEIQNLTGNQNMHRDSIKSQLTLGGKTYENVIIQTRNTDSISGINFKVNKVYLAAGHGIIGFVDNEGSLYHR